MEKRIFNMQKTIKEVTVTLDLDDYIEIMASLKTISDGINSASAANLAKEIKDLIEEIQPEYIWD